MVPAGILPLQLRLLIAALAAACVLAPMAAARSGDGELSPRLAELAKPSVRTASAAEQARALSLAPTGAGSLLRQGNRVLADVRFEHGATAAAEDLRAAGAQIVHVSDRYETVTVAARPAELGALAGVAGVVGVTEILAPITSATSCAGLVTSEGDAQLGAPAARTDFNLDGAGVTVGVLSDSFDLDGGAPTRAAGDVATGDLPGPGNPCGRTVSVNRLNDSYAPLLPSSPAPADEGRAMAQIVHDLAPGASLAFATAFLGPTSFASQIRRLASPVAAGGAGASVLVDDVTYLEEPFFQDGPIAVAANEMAARGVAYFSAAGNNNQIDAEGHDAASWEAGEFRDSGGCPAEVPAFAGHCLDFDPGAGTDRTLEITVGPDETLIADLQWAQPWYGVKTDLDAYVLDGSTVVGESEDPNTDPSVDRPVEIVSWENPGDPGDPSQSKTVSLVINRCDSACGTARALAHVELEGTSGGDAGTPRVKVVLAGNGGDVSLAEHSTSSAGDTVGPTIFGHSGATGAIGVAAVPFFNSSTPEEYSSRGPVAHYFGPVTSTSPAPASAQTISKPDLAATDCGLTTFFVPREIPGIHRFCGTSAAAPHAAAVAALMREANPSLPLSQLRTALAATARPVGLFGPDAVGAGLVNAYGAVRSVALPPLVKITNPPNPVSKNRSPSIAFTANRPVAFSCTLDGSPLFPCTTPFVPSEPLGNGLHGFAVQGVDLAGRVGSSSTVSFTVDTRRPRTFLRKRPRKTLRTRHRRAKAVFAFRSNEQDVTFVCRVDRGLYRFCPRRLVRRFGIGEHVLRVKAVDKAGNDDATPAVYRFRVKHVT